MKNDLKQTIIQSTIGSGTIDNKGAAIGVSRMDVEKAYKGINKLLQQVIRDSDEEAWVEIKAKIDYIYENISELLFTLDQETNFVSQIKERIAKGQKILFKPNLVSTENINPYNFGSAFGSTAMTEWPFVAAIMRWFHDKANISYYKMSLGEAATTSSLTAAHYTYLKGKGRVITTEAAIEGRSDNFYGGWGFYFVRIYLSEASVPSMGDDPMRGLEESINGTYLPPGVVNDKLMIYDLNKISDDPSKGRDIPVPESENYRVLTLHKVVIGGDPNDPNDRSLYPGSILINLSKLKVHTQSLLSNVIKNIGIGLYPMETANSNDYDWKYAKPDTLIPGLRSTIPHQIWIPELDLITFIPKKDTHGNYIVKKTGGLTGTMLDMVKAIANQDIFMIHVVDSIEAINLDHQGIGFGVKVSEGLVMASLDPVALDLMCARYLFSNVGLKEAKDSGLEDEAGGLFPQAVPIPRFDGNQIGSGKGYDCPIKRDQLLQRAEKAGLGERKYYIVGKDTITNFPLVSLGGRLGFVKEGKFTEIYTKTLYFDIYKVPWDLQKTFFEYLDIVDKLENISLKKQFLNTFDENNDGIVSYEEYGKKGLFGSTMYITSHYLSARGQKDESEVYRTLFATLVTNLRNSNPKWNPDEHHVNREYFYGSVALTAMNMSQLKKDIKDPFVQELKCGNGKWPSFSFAKNTYVHQQLYGYKFPSKIGIFSLYGVVFCYADYTQNNQKFIGSLRGFPNPECANEYIKAVQNGQANPLDFTFYVPKGYGGNGKIPNVLETSDPKKILTAEFEKGTIKWPDARIASF